MTHQKQEHKRETLVVVEDVVEVVAAEVEVVEGPGEEEGDDANHRQTHIIIVRLLHSESWILSLSKIYMLNVWRSHGSLLASWILITIHCVFGYFGFLKKEDGEFNYEIKMATDIPL